MMSVTPTYIIIGLAVFAILLAWTEPLRTRRRAKRRNERDRREFRDERTNEED